MSAPALRVARAAAWSIALFGLLLVADRWLIGPEVIRGWQSSARLADLPPSVGPIATPAYRPEALGWPPHRVYFRLAPAPAWWLQLGGADGSQLWIGSGEPPVELPAQRCLGDAACPPGWRALTRRIQGQGIAVVGTLPPYELRRILDALVMSVP